MVRADANGRPLTPVLSAPVLYARADSVSSVRRNRETDLKTPDSIRTVAYRREQMFVKAAQPRTRPIASARVRIAPSESPDPPDPRASGRQPSTLDAAALEREIGELAGRIAAATCRWLLLVGEFDHRDEHERHGFARCAHWLAWRCSVSRRTAFEYVRVARALRGLPAVTASFAAGRITYSKVRALTRVAAPEDERALLEMAEEATAAQLERILLGYGKAIGAGEAAQARARRHFSTRWEDDGSLRINGNLPAEEGALLLKAIEAVEDRLRRERAADALADAGPGDDYREREIAARSPAPSAADAVVALADDALARRSADRERSGGDRYQVVCHVDIADLRDPGAASCNGVVEDHAALAPATMARLACDASVVTIVESDGEPVSVGRKTRAIPPSIARALRSRDRGCRFPGCASRRFVDAHHVEHWAAGGETSLANLIQLCRHHHRLVHEAGFGVEMVAGSPLFKRPDGTVIPEAPPLPAAARDQGREGAMAPLRRPPSIGPWTVAARSRGAPFDLGLAVGILARRRE